MSDDTHVPSVEKILDLHRHINHFISAYAFGSAKDHSFADKAHILSAIRTFEWVTTAPPYRDGAARRVRGWPAAPMLAALRKLEDIGESLRARWKQASVLDLPPYQGSPIPDFALEIEEKDLDSLTKIAEFLGALPMPWVPSEMDGPKLRLVRGPDGELEQFASRQDRLKAVTNVNHPYFILDGKPIACDSDAAVHFVAALIEADGHQVPFTTWQREHPKFEGEQSNRVLDAVPDEILQFIERGQGRPARLRVDLLGDDSSDKD